MISPYLFPVVLLIGSNAFMTTAWYWHLRFKEVPLWQVILISWGLAFFEYCLAVPANRYGSAVYTAAQLKTIQEVVTLVIFGVFSVGLSAPGGDLESGGRFCADRRRRILRFPRAALMPAGLQSCDAIHRRNPCDAINTIWAIPKRARR